MAGSLRDYVEGKAGRGTWTGADDERYWQLVERINEDDEEGDS